MTYLTEREDKFTRTMHVTRDGTTLTAIYNVTWDDWDQIGPDADVIPFIGDAWDDTRPDLICTDLQTSGVSNINVTVTAIFSTEGMSNRQESVNQVGSWQETMDVSLEEQWPEQYFDTSSSDVKDWQATWTAHTGSDIVLSPMPPLRYFRPIAVWTRILYGSLAEKNKILTELGKINSDTNVLDVYGTDKAKSESRYDDDTSGVTDGGKWLFSGVTMRRIRADTIEYTFTFMWNTDGWNTWQGATVNLYNSFAFSTLFENMRLFSDPDDNGLRA